MDIKSLMECSYVTDVIEKGANVEFDTYIYSSDDMSIKKVTIRCPVSGDFILTECAQIIGHESNDETKNILKDLFTALDESSRVEKSIVNKDVVYTPFDTSIKEGVGHFLKELNLDIEDDIEDIKFNFLSKCSKIFTKVYEHNKNKKYDTGRQ
jgi:hypothetical protein